MNGKVLKFVAVLLKSSMNGNHLKWIIFSSMAGIVASLDVSCPVPENQEQLTCKCITGNAVQWYQEAIKLSDCSPSMCIGSPAGYTFTASAGEYVIAIDTFNDSFCDKYSCSDASTSEVLTFPDCVDPTDTNTTTTTTTTTTPAPSTTTTSTTTTTPTTTTSPSTTASTTSASTGGNSKLAAEVIAPAVLGGVLLVLGITIAIAVFVCRRSKLGKADGSELRTSPNRRRTHPNRAISTRHPGSSPAYITPTSMQPLGQTNAAYIGDGDRNGYYSYPAHLSYEHGRGHRNGYNSKPAHSFYEHGRGNRYDYSYPGHSSYEHGSGNRYGSYPGYSSHEHGRRTVYEAHEVPKDKHSRHGYGDHSGYTVNSYRM